MFYSPVVESVYRNLHGEVQSLRGDTDENGQQHATYLCQDRRLYVWSLQTGSSVGACDGA